MTSKSNDYSFVISKEVDIFNLMKGRAFWNIFQLGHYDFIFEKINHVYEDCSKFCTSYSKIAGHQKLKNSSKSMFFLGLP